MRSHVILAIFKRNVASYFSGVLGYLFIVVFVVAAAAFAYTQQFFANNLATLDQLNAVFPLLLLFIVPAITMTAWSEEKKLGTEELLFTLPATDFEIVIAKYLSVLAVYSVALLFSVAQLFVLAYYADPDAGVLFANYLGFWLAGAALLSAGMFASAMTSSATVAFVLGAAICAVPVFLGEIAAATIAVFEFVLPFTARLLPSPQFFQQLSVGEQFQEFALGMVPLSGLVYFGAFTALMLYLNLVLVSRRHWSGTEQTSMGAQYLVRAVSLVVILASLNVMSRATADVYNLRADLTSERAYTLSPATRDLLRQLDENRPVTIQAFLSPEVPQEYVNLQRRLVGLLRQFDRLGGRVVDVRLVEVDAHSPEAEEADALGVERRQLQTERGGKVVVEDVFLGAVVTSPYDEVVIPFFDLGMPLEYELTQSVRTVSNQKRGTIGILSTDAQVMGGFDRASFNTLPQWQIVNELRKQYNVERVDWKRPAEDFSAPEQWLSPDDVPIAEKEYEVLLAVLPSSLTQPQLDAFVDHVRQGHPALIFDDPMPALVGMQHAPRVPKQSPGGPFGGGPPPEPRAYEGRATSLLSALDVAWDNGEIVWDNHKPYPQFEGLVSPELVFIGPGSGNRNAFGRSGITEGLHEVLTFFPGTLRRPRESDLEFEPLLQSGAASGVLAWEEIVDDAGFMGPRLRNPERIYRVRDEFAHTVAAHIRAKGEGGPNVVYVADADMISDQIVRLATMRRLVIGRQEVDLRIDNVKFVLNAIDVLSGNEDHLALRNREPQPRRLTRIQAQVDRFRRERQDKEAEAERKADERLAEAQKRLDEAQEAIRQKTDLDVFERSQQILTAAETETRLLAVEREEIERNKQREVNRLKGEEQRQIRSLEDRIRWQAVVLPPIPPILIGVILLSLRLHRERKEIEPSRFVGK